jgi:predicted nucleic acid-binding protein
LHDGKSCFFFALSSQLEPTSLTQVETLLSLIRQLEATVLELQETTNFVDREHRLNEAAAYQKGIAAAIERLENEHFRKDPRKGLRRALTRYDAAQVSRDNPSS